MKGYFDITISEMSVQNSTYFEPPTAFYPSGMVGGQDGEIVLKVMVFRQTNMQWAIQDICEAMRRLGFVQK